MKYATIVGALCCYLAIAAAPAQAGWKMDRATAIANTVWNTPCDGHVDRLWFNFYEPPDPSPPGALASTQVEICRVQFNSGERWPWEKLCTVVIHEWGHLAWFRDPSNPADPIHSSNPDSVMYVGVGAGNFEPTRGWVTDRHGKRHYVMDWTDTSMDERCRENGRPYLEQHGLLKRKRPRR